MFFRTVLNSYYKTEINNDMKRIRKTNKNNQEKSGI